MAQVQSRLDSFPAVHMTFESWVRFCYGYEPWEYDEHIHPLKIAYTKIFWSKHINTDSKHYT